MVHADVSDILATHGMQPLRMTREEFRRYVDDEARRAARIIRAPR
jgi:tripartite-type tricarboxylate transporter receptor subunit TctC